MKNGVLLVVCSFCIHLSLIAQRVVAPTNAFTVQGDVVQPITFTLAAFDTMPATSLPNLVITNHKGEIKDTLTGLAGVPLKRVLASIQYKHQKPRDLSEFYFVMTATDGYKIVCSWNEIYNNASGDQFYMITAMNGKKLPQLEQRMVFLAMGDIRTGRRYVKGLEKIEVRRLP